MPERDYYNTDEWNTAGGWEGTGQGDPGQAYGDPYTPPPPPDPEDPVRGPMSVDNYTPPTGGGGGGGGGGQSGPSFDWGSFSAPSFDWPSFNAPSYVSPGEFTYADFAAPSMQDAENEPGYKFARDQGAGALQNSAAARGVLRSGGTLKDILEYGNKFAEQNYGNVYNRAANTYGINRSKAWDAYGAHAADIQNQNQYNYRSAWDTFSSKDSQRKFELSDALDRWKAKLGSLTSLSQPVL